MPKGQNIFVRDERQNTAQIATDGRQYVSESYTDMTLGYTISITAASGGTQLGDVPCGKVVIQNLSGNAPMFWGSVEQNAPYSGRGMWIYGNQEKEIYFTNSNLVRVCASVSGQLLMWSAYGRGTVDQDTQGTAPDLTPPTITFSVPASGDVGVARDQSGVWAQFSEPIAAATITTSSLLVRLSGDAEPAKLSGSALRAPTSSSIALFVPNSGQLAASSWYSLFVATSITDTSNNPLAVSGEFPFLTTGTAPPSDTTPPTMISTTPFSGSQGNSTTTDPQFVFNENLQAITGNEVKLTKSGSSTGLGGTLTLASNLRTLNYNIATLDYSAWYRLAVSGVRDIAGNAMTPVTVPFNTTIPTLTQIYAITTGTDVDPLDPAGKWIGEKITSTASTMYGAKVHMVKVYLRYFDSPGASDTVSCRIRSTVGVNRATIGTLNILDTLSSAVFRQISFINLSNTYSTNLTDVISIENDNTSNFTVEVRYNGNTAEGEQVLGVWRGSSWEEYATNDLRVEVYT